MPEPDALGAPRTRGTLDPSKSDAATIPASLSERPARFLGRSGRSLLQPGWGIGCVPAIAPGRAEASTRPLTL